MPVIATTDQETALRLQRAIVEGPVAPPDDSISVVTGWPEGAGFLVSDELMAAYEDDLVAHADAPASPACRTGNDCYSASCVEVAPFPATGAIAGIPGTWTPAGSTPPATPADLQGGIPNAVVASPATGWTTGQFVQTQLAGAAGRATWTGSGWVGGIAP